ncbi:MAG: FlgD immunoglobulin-like domain containing protein [Spirochaetota bacterium]
MKKFFGAAMFIFILISSIYAVDIKSVVAYPVPFNPQNEKLTIGYPQSNLPAGIKSRVTVFDINGDVVTVINGSASGKVACKWNGRRSNGEYVKPGLYLLKIEISDNDGGYWKKTLRVLVKY